MTINLRARFKERQRKRLSESIMVNHSPSKRPCSESLCPKPVLVVVLVLAPSTAAIGINLELDERFLSVEGTTHHELRRLSPSSEHLNNESIECVASFSSRPKLSHIPILKEIAHARLHEFRDDKSGKSFSSFIHSTLVFDFLTIFLLPSQVIAEVPKSNVAKAIRIYIAHNMDDSEELWVRLETLGGKVVAA